MPGCSSAATIVEMGKFDALRALQLIEAHQVNWVTMVPTMMHRIWRLGPDVLSRFTLPSLRMMLHMAAPCAAWLKEAWIGWLGSERVHEYYGTTEGIGSTMISGTDWLAHPGSVGRVRDGYELAILDEEGQRCPTGQVGEIYFRPHAGRRARLITIWEAALERVGEWESPGDLGCVDEDGYFYLSDRRNDLIISGGANIYPAEVEAVLDAHPSVRTSAVIGAARRGPGRARPCDRAAHRGRRAERKRSCSSSSLGDSTRFKLPKSIELTSEPLRDEAGKMRRAALQRRGRTKRD